MVLSLFTSASIVPLRRRVIMPLMAQSPSTSQAKHAQACVQWHTITFFFLSHDSHNALLSAGLNFFYATPSVFLLLSSFCSTPFYVNATLLNVSLSDGTNCVMDSKKNYNNNKKLNGIMCTERESMLQISVNIILQEITHGLLFSFQCKFHDLN